MGASNTFPAVTLRSTLGWAEVGSPGRVVKHWLHAVAADGVYVPGPDGQPNFRALPRLKTDEVGDVLQVARVRILRYALRPPLAKERLTLLPDNRVRHRAGEGELCRPCQRSMAA